MYVYVSNYKHCVCFEHALIFPAATHVATLLAAVSSGAQRKDGHAEVQADGFLGIAV